MMPRITTAPALPVPSKADIEATIVELVAGAREQDVGAVRTDLLAGGAAMPLDSLEGVEIIVGLEDRLGIRLPDSTETCEALRSVSTLAELATTVARSG